MRVDKYYSTSTLSIVVDVGWWDGGMDSYSHTLNIFWESDSGTRMKSPLRM